MAAIKTDNEFMVASNGTQIAPLLPVSITTREQGYRLAAWLVAMSFMLPTEQDQDQPGFEAVLQAVQST